MKNPSANPYKQTSFIVAVVVLFVAAVGLNASVAKMQLHFKKLPVPLQRDLMSIPSRMGPWMQVSLDEPLDGDVEEVLGTRQYIFRDYLNLEAHGGQSGGAMVAALYPQDPQKGLDLQNKYLNAPAAQRPALLEAELKDKTADERKRAALMVQEQYPDAVINAAVTYYTGLVDTVAHIPERCYVADGYEPASTPETPEWTLSNGRQITVRFIHFEDQSGASRISRCVGYFFQVNGMYKDNPEEVRFTLENLFAKYGYYAKVELMTQDPSSDESARTMNSFLSSSLGELEKTFPDWNKIAGTS